MRTGTCTVQQALTAEAAAVLKQSLALARRRGHAQVTPLHVAATLLSSMREPSSSLLRRACLRSHPLHPSSHPFHCRALELCFNVALNRLPTTPPPSSAAPLLPPQPSLSNALVAALKRAQAHQRRGCIEQQQLQQGQQQPLLAVKVEVEQLIISILDDPSVSRVMREAGFSSTCVKSNLEDSSSSAASSSSYCSSSPPSAFLGSRREPEAASLWRTQLLRPPPDRRAQPLAASRAEDLKAVLDGLAGRSPRRRSRNTVVVGDSVAYCESLVAEVAARVESGDVPGDLAATQFVRLHLSPVQLRFMCRGDVESKIADLRRKVGSLALERKRVVVHLGDLRWAVGDGRSDDGYSAADHAVAELASLQSEWTCSNGGGSRVWLIATASYQTHLKCQMRRPSLESQWDLQAVLVPAGGLTLSINAPSSSKQEPSIIRSLPGSEKEKLACCGQCASSFEREASALRPAGSGNAGGSLLLPFWVRPQEPNQEEVLDELRRKWNRVCWSLHRGVLPVRPLLGPHSNAFTDPGAASVAGFAGGRGDGSFLGELGRQWFSGRAAREEEEEVRTALVLSNTASSDCTSSKDSMVVPEFDLLELRRGLEENIPWQCEAAGPVAEALLEQRSAGKGSWLLIQGTDVIAAQRMALVLAEFFGSEEGVVSIDARMPDCRKMMNALLKDGNRVFFVQMFDRADCDFLRILSEGMRIGFLHDSGGRVVATANAIFLLSAQSSDFSEKTPGVIKMALRAEDRRSGASMLENFKRKPEYEMPEESRRRSKSPRLEGLDLNLDLEEEEEEHISSEITHEEGAHEFGGPSEFFQSIEKRFVFSIDTDRRHPAVAHYVSRIVNSFAEARGGRSLSVDEDVAAGIAGGAGSFTEQVFKRWLLEVFQTCLVTVKDGGNLRLTVEGKEGNVLECGFRRTILPSRVSTA